MARTLIIEGALQGTWSLLLPPRVELSIKAGTVVQFRCGAAELQVEVSDGVCWLPSAQEDRSYVWPDLPSVPCAGLKLTCVPDNRDADIKELTTSCLEMQSAATELMRKHDDLQTQVADLRQRLTQALEQVDWLKDALSEATLDKERAHLQCEALKAKCAAYQSTLEALKTPEQDALDEVVQEQVRRWGKCSLVRVSEGKYLCEGRAVSVTIKAGCLMARTASGLQPLRDWLVAMIP